VDGLVPDGLGRPSNSMVPSSGRFHTSFSRSLDILFKAGRRTRTESLLPCLELGALTYALHCSLDTAGFRFQAREQENRQKDQAKRRPWYGGVRGGAEIIGVLILWSSSVCNEGSGVSQNLVRLSCCLRAVNTCGFQNTPSQLPVPCLIAAELESHNWLQLCCSGWA
jgi:hypothetical protein